MKEAYDIGIVGSGFSGSLLAMIARRLGLSVVLLEKTKHPRFAIGESSTPVANLLLEELATRYDLPRLLPLTKWGTWQRSYPQVSVGLKRGFTFLHHTFDAPYIDDDRHWHQLLVAASPHDGISDTHWYRPDFDHFLMQEAQQAGADYYDETSIHDVAVSNEGATLQCQRHGQSFTVLARFLVDATGPRGFLHRTLQLPEIALEHLPPTQGLFTHFTDVQRLEDMAGLTKAEVPPYPLDDAAVHHVFDGGWMWVLRFNNGITSAGVAIKDDLAQELRLSEGAPAWERLLGRLPTVRQQFETAHATMPFIHAPRLAFRSGAGVGPGWAMLPSAAGFIDPLLSTGFPLTLLGVLRLGEALANDWDTPRFTEQLQRYALHTTQELLAAERMVAALYANMHDFELFAALSLLYFAAASFTETARRLDKPQLAGGFLLHDHPRFGPAARACCERALQPLTPSSRAQLMADIKAAIAPFDVAGLTRTDRHNRYPVDAQDLFAAADKLGATHEELTNLLARCGFATV
ncbi:MAG: tryptophan 7-halogenase [Abitibacteriaceae bacterium]|nr:tryptophan 7-halogenase [Abditibacteriaceae bacterium]